MIKIIKTLLLFAFLLSALFGRDARAQTINAASCSQHDVVVALGSVAAERDDGCCANMQCYLGYHDGIHQR